MVVYPVSRMTLDSWRLGTWYLVMSFEGAMVYIRHHVDTWWHHGWSQYFSRNESLLPLAVQSMLDRSGNASCAAFNASLLFPPVIRKVFIWAEYSLFNIVISSFIFASHRSTLLRTTPAQTKKHLISTSLVQLLARRARILLAILLLPSSWRDEFTGKWVNLRLGEKKSSPSPPNKKKTWGSLGQFNAAASSVWCHAMPTSWMPWMPWHLQPPKTWTPQKQKKTHPETSFFLEV